MTVSAVEDHAAVHARHPVLTLAVAVLLFAAMLLLIGARSPHQAHDTAAADGRKVESASLRTASESAWNDQEDLKAARYVGQPGVY